MNSQILADARFQGECIAVMLVLRIWRRWGDLNSPYGSFADSCLTRLGYTVIFINGSRMTRTSKSFRTRPFQGRHLPLVYASILAETAGLGPAHPCGFARSRGVWIIQFSYVSISKLLISERTGFEPAQDFSRLFSKQGPYRIRRPLHNFI